MKKRMITICVLAAMLLSCASCGSTETGNDETTKSGGTDTTVGDTTAEPTEYDKYPLPEKDMEGFNLRFCNYDDSWLTWTIKTLDVEEENGDKLNDAVYARNRRVEEKYNCQITEELVENPGNSMSGYIMSRAGHGGTTPRTKCSRSAESSSPPSVISPSRWCAAGLS